MSFLCRIDVERLAEACHGVGTNDTDLIALLTTRNKKFLARLSRSYRQIHGEDLPKLVDGELSGWYKYLTNFIVLEEKEADRLLLDLAMDGIGTNEKALIEFLCARSPHRVRVAKKAWEGRHDASLVDRLSSELSGDLKTLALTMLKGKRTTEKAGKEADGALAKEQAAQLKEAADGCGTDEATFFEVLCNASPVQSAAIAQAYEDE